MANVTPGASDGQNRTVFGTANRKGSTGSFLDGTPGVKPRIKSSLMGTSARQKLLQLRLAAHANKIEANQEDKVRIESHIADLNKINMKAAPADETS